MVNYAGNVANLRQNKPAAKRRAKLAVMVYQATGNLVPKHKLEMLKTKGILEKETFNEQARSSMVEAAAEQAAAEQALEATATDAQATDAQATDAQAADAQAADEAVEAELKRVKAWLHENYGVEPDDVQRLVDSAKGRSQHTSDAASASDVQYTGFSAGTGHVDVQREVVRNMEAVAAHGLPCFTVPYRSCERIPQVLYDQRFHDGADGSKLAAVEQAAAEQVAGKQATAAEAEAEAEAEQAARAMSSDGFICCGQWEQLDLRCALSHQRLKRPAKGRDCRHVARCNYDALRTYAGSAAGRVGGVATCPMAGCAAKLRRTRDVECDEALAAQLQAVPAHVPTVWLSGSKITLEHPSAAAAVARGEVMTMSEGCRRKRGGSRPPDLGAQGKALQAVVTIDVR